MALLKVNTKGGNRPIRARYGPLEDGGQPQAVIIYAYGDCLALAFKASESASCIIQKQDLLPSLHGRELMAILGLNGGKTILTGSEDTTFKVIKVANGGRELSVEQTFS